MIDEEFKVAVSHHEDGELSKAKLIYEKILNENPKHHQAMHMLGILALQQKSLSKAHDWFSYAIKLAPKIAYYHVNLANTLKLLCDYSGATEQYNIAIQLSPHYPEAHCNLSNLYYELGQLEKAKNGYITALSQDSSYFQAKQNLALCYLRLTQFEKAIELFKQLLDENPYNLSAQFYLATAYLQLDHIQLAKENYQQIIYQQPNNVDAINNLGAISLKENNPLQACEYFQQAVNIEPNNTEVRTNLAASYMQLDKYSEAITHYDYLAPLKIDEVEVYYNRGVALMAVGHISDACHDFEKVIALKPTMLDAMINLASCHHRLNRLDKAKYYYQECLNLHPDNQSVQYMLAAMEGTRQHANTPSDYVENLFDYYADNFDNHLVNTLNYQIPSLIINAIKHVSSNFFSTCLDLGCGTGLCGYQIKPICNQLVGIDLSKKMLKKAEQKNCYTELHASDIIKFFENDGRTWNLIIAAEVLVYFGELDTLFTHCFKKLTTEGLFAFTTEISHTENYFLQKTGRFCHHEDYIRQLAENHATKVMYFNTVCARQHEKENMESYLVILKKNKPTC